MSERRDITEQLAKEHWTVFVDFGGGHKEEWFSLICGMWSSLEVMVEGLRSLADERLREQGKQTGSLYLNTDRHELTFYVRSKQEEWWTL